MEIDWQRNSPTSWRKGVWTIAAIKSDGEWLYMLTKAGSSRMTWHKTPEDAREDAKYEDLWDSNA